MGILEAIILGFIQGITEFFPVSSSGHLTLLPILIERTNSSLNFDFQDTAFDGILHMATFIAILIAYRKKIWAILQKWKERSNFILIRNILLTSTPAILIAGIFEALGLLENQSPVLTAFNLIWVGVVLLAVEFMPKIKTATGEAHGLNKKQAVSIGLLQGMSLLRGVSRSGITLIAGLWQGLSKEAALEYAFLSSIPVFAAVSIFSIGKVFIDRSDLVASNNQLLAGFLAALLSGILVITLFRSLIKKRYVLAAFGFYRIILGIILLVVLI